MAGNCGTCKWWEDDRGWRKPTDEGPRWSGCSFIHHGYDHVDHATSERASVSDASGYYAGLNTREDFGCIEWDEKPDVRDLGDDPTGDWRQPR